MTTALSTHLLPILAQPAFVDVGQPLLTCETLLLRVVASDRRRGGGGGGGGTFFQGREPLQVPQQQGLSRARKPHHHHRAGGHLRINKKTITRSSGPAPVVVNERWRYGLQKNKNRTKK